MKTLITLKNLFAKYSLCLRALSAPISGCSELCKKATIASIAVAGLAALVMPVSGQTVLTKSVDKSSVAVGDTLTYTLHPRHNAASALNGVTVTDLIPTGTSYVASSANAGGTEAGGTITWDLGNATKGTDAITPSGIGAFSALADITNDFGGQDSISPDIAIDGSGYMHVVFQGKATGASRINVYYTNNSSGSWSTPLLLSDDTDGQDALMPSITNDSAGNAHIIYTDKSGSDSKRNTYYTKVTSAGVVLSGPTRLSADVNDALNPDIAVVGSNVHVTYVDKTASDNRLNVYYQVSTNGGTSFSTAEKLSDDTDGQDALTPVIAVESGGTVHIVFTDDTSDDKRNVYYTSGTSGSFSSLVMLSDDTDGQNASNPDIAMDGNDDVHIVYQDKQSGDAKINLYYLTDPGGSLGTPVNVTNDFFSQDSLNPAIATDSRGVAHLTFTNVGDGDKIDIFYVNNIGGSFGIPTHQFTDNLAGQNALNPAIAVSPDRVEIVFDARDPSDSKRNVYHVGTDATIGTTTSVAASPAIGITGDIVTVTATITVTEDLDGVLPSITPTGANGMNVTAVSTPTAQNLTANTSATFVWTYTITETGSATPGEIGFSVSESLIDPVYGSVNFGTATSNGVIATPPLTFQVTVNNGAPGNIQNTASIQDEGELIEIGNGRCYAIADTTTTSADIDEDRLVYIEDNNGTLEFHDIGATGTTHIEAATWSPDLTKLYVTERVSAGSDDFGYLNLTTGVFISIGRIASSTNLLEGSLGNFSVLDIDGMSFDPVSGDLYAVHRRESVGTQEDLLLKIDPATGLHIEDAFGPGVDYLVLDTSPLGLYDIDDMAFHPTTGILYAIANSTSTGSGDLDRLVTINTSSGAVTDIGRITNANGGSVINDVEGLSIDADGTIHATTGDGDLSGYRDSLWVVNASTAEATLVFAFSTEPNAEIYDDYEAIACHSTLTTNGQQVIPSIGSNTVLTSLTGTVTGHLYTDTNGDGDQDAGEPNLANVDVVITDSNGNDQTVTTDANGNWTATVPPGSTSVNVDETDPQYPTGSAQTEGNDPTTVTAVAGANTDGGTDGYYVSGTVTGHLYIDTNGDGDQDAGEPNLANVDVVITDSNGGAQTVTTDASGNWTATVPPGSTSINVDETDPQYPTGSAQTEGNDPTTVTAVAGANTDGGTDGYYVSGTVTGHLYIDTNGDGDQDAGEPNLANVDVVITDSNGGTQTVTTNASGNWTATVPPGSTQADVDESDPQYPKGSTQTEGTDPTTVTVVAGSSTATDNDGYYYPPASVTGHLYIDINGDGDQDAGEPNLAGIDVLITDSNGGTRTVTTDGNGNWTADVPAGSTTANVDENDEQYPAGYAQTEGDDPTTVIAVIGTEVDAGNDGYYLDLDSDDDGIPDTVEIANNCDGDGDTDGDGVPDILDLDSDGDGIFDIVESGNGALDADLDGRVDSTQGNNGLADALETAPDSGLINYVLPDRDGDLRPDHLDLDSDNDSISDVLEYGNAALIDIANDGIADGVVNSEGTVPFAGSTTAVNSDSDLTPDYLDWDSNADGMFDIVDNGFGSLDINLDGMIDDTTSGDCDGIPDILDPKDEEYGWFPEMGCTAWNLNNEDDTDGDVFPIDQEYAFGGDPELGDHLVAGTTHRAGMTITKNASGGIDISYVRPQGRFDVSVTPYVSDDPRDAGKWTPVYALPSIVANGDTTETVTWSDIHDIDDNALVTRDRGFVRLMVETPCNPAGSWTLVQGWCRENVVGKHQTYGVNFSSMPVFTGIVDSALDSTLTLTRSGKGQNLDTYLTGGAACFIEFTDGPAEGHRIDITSGGVDTLILDLTSVNNTIGTLPESLADSHFVIREHDTLGGIYPNIEWNSASSPGSADQVLLFNGVGYDTYYNLSNLTWVLQGGGFTIRNGLIIAPGTGMMVVHANPNDDNEMLSFGDLRYNDFKKPLHLGSKGLNFMELGYPFDATPAELNMDEVNGFVRASSPGSATQILNWLGDTVPNTTGWETNFLLTATGWYTQGNLSNVTTNSPLFRECRSTFVLVRKDNLSWTHPLPWPLAPWVQP